MLWLDEKYARLLGPSLERFTAKGGHNFNFRCPLCGDSARVKTKARGYLYPNGDKLFYKCHNCNIALPFAALLKRHSVLLYNEYVFEKLQDSATTPVIDTPVPKVGTIHPNLGKVPVYDVASQSSATASLHNVFRFLKDRQLPDSALTRLYATRQAKTWLEPLVGDEKVKELTDGVPFLIQPFRLKDGSWYGAQIRRVDKKEFYTSGGVMTR